MCVCREYVSVYVCVFVWVPAHVHICMYTLCVCHTVCVCATFVNCNEYICTLSTWNQDNTNVLAMCVGWKESDHRSPWQQPEGPCQVLG